MKIASTRIRTGTIDALLDLSKNRLAVRRKCERKNGLKYTERRVLFTADAEIAGETVDTAHRDFGDG